MNKIILVLTLIVLTGCNNVHVRHVTDKENGHQFIVITTDFKQGIEVIHDPDCVKCKKDSI